MIICHLNFKRTENHNIAITTNTSQHVEFFHSLIFTDIGSMAPFPNGKEGQILLTTLMMDILIFMVELKVSMPWAI